MRGYQWDPTKWMIRTMAAMGWAWNLRRIPRERIVAAELECETQRLLERVKDRSDYVLAAVRQRVADISAALERSAARLGALEREFGQACQSWGEERRRQLRAIRAEMRVARRDFRAARSRWRAAIEELHAEPLPMPAL